MTIGMRRRRISGHNQDHLIEHFVAGTTARTVASLCGGHRNSAALYFTRLRRIIAKELEAESEAQFGGEIEGDESYFGGRRKGKRGRGAAGKTPVFGLLKRGGRVYAKITPDALSSTLIPIIERKVIPDSIVYPDSCRTYNVLDVSEFKHLRINHSKLFADKHNHINGIENFWNQAKCFKLSVICANLMVSQSQVSGYFSRKASGVSTTVLHRLNYRN